MGQEERRIPEAAPLAHPQGEPIGRYLARQRALRSISLDELAEITRIPRRSLERLEAGAFDGCTDGFARGFVRTVAAALGLDPEATVAQMLPEVAPPTRAARARREQPGTRALRKRLLVAAAAAAVVWLAVATGWIRLGASPRRGLVVRVDPVRELARERGLLPPLVLPEAEASQGAAGSQGSLLARKPRR